MLRMLGPIGRVCMECARLCLARERADPRRQLLIIYIRLHARAPRCADGITAFPACYMPSNRILAVDYRVLLRQSVGVQRPLSGSIAAAHGRAAHSPMGARWR